MNTVEILENFDLPTTSFELARMDDLHSAQCCDCVYDDHGYRVWVCRCENGVTIEAYIDGVWTTISGDCMEVLY